MKTLTFFLLAITAFTTTHAGEGVFNPPKLKCELQIWRPCGGECPDILVDKVERIFEFQKYGLSPGRFFWRAEEPNIGNTLSPTTYPQYQDYQVSATVSTDTRFWDWKTAPMEQLERAPLQIQASFNRGYGAIYASLFYKQGEPMSVELRGPRMIIQKEDKEFSGYLLFVCSR